MGDDELPDEEPGDEEPEIPIVIDSILTSIKKLLGIAADYTEFDYDILVHINSAFTSLYQLGVGPTTAFSISDETAVWSDFMGDRTDVEAVKSYVYLKVRLIFDPPQTGYLVDAIKAQLVEFEWRLCA